MRGDTFTSIPKEVLDQHDPLNIGKYYRRVCRLSGGHDPNQPAPLFDSLSLQVRINYSHKQGREFTAIDNALTRSRELLISLSEPLCLLQA